MGHVTARDEGAQDALDDGAQRAALLGEAFRVDGEEGIDVLANQAEQRRVLGPPGPIDLGADLHAVFAGGRGRPFREMRRPSSQACVRRAEAASLQREVA